MRIDKNVNIEIKDENKAIASNKFKKILSLLLGAREMIIRTSMTRSMETNRHD